MPGRQQDFPDLDTPKPGPRGTAADLIPPGADLAALRRIAAGCTACPLYRNATRTVFGEGPAAAKLMLVGETPGDREDIEGHPFVGPAGKLLDRCLEEAGIERGQAYVTNVVKHFKWVPRGKRRLHQKPNSMEIQACTPWLNAELAAVRPKVLVALGATAAQALFGRSFRVTRQRGVPVETPLAPQALATVHPSSLLRLPDEERDAAVAEFVADLRQAAQALRRSAA